MKFYEIFEIYFEILGNLLKFWKSAIGQHSTNSVNGRNKRMFSRSQYVFFQVNTNPNNPVVILRSRWSL